MTSDCDSLRSRTDMKRKLISANENLESDSKRTRLIVTIPTSTMALNESADDEENTVDDRFEFVHSYSSDPVFDFE